MHGVRSPKHLPSPRFAPVVAIVVVVALACSACGDAGEAASTSTAPTAIPATPAGTTPSTGGSAAPSSTATTAATAPAGPPPLAYSEVEGDYSASVTAVLAEGRDAVDLLLAGAFEAVHARFDEQMVALTPVEDLRSGLEELASQGPLGARQADRAVQLNPSRRAYRAVVEWGDETVAITAVFDDAGRIADLGVVPQGTLAPDPAADYASQVVFRLPFDGLWFVLWGGDAELQNYHVVARDQRHALDLTIWRDGGTHRSDGTANEDYWAYGQQVLAPAAGTVVTVADGLADNAPQVETDAANPAGNHVVIRVADGEYVLIAHMQPGSLMVTEGDSVVAGQPIGLVGNSGNTSEPHIHIHLHDRPTFDPGATGLPLVFNSYVANGQPVESGELTADQFVANG